MLEWLWKIKPWKGRSWSFEEAVLKCFCRAYLFLLQNWTQLNLPKILSEKEKGVHALLTGTVSRPQGAGGLEGWWGLEPAQETPSKTHGAHWDLTMPEGWLGLRRLRAQQSFRETHWRRWGRQVCRPLLQGSRASVTPIQKHRTAAPQELLSYTPCKDSMNMSGFQWQRSGKLLHTPPMEMKPSDPSSLGLLPIFETQRCSDTGNNLGLCMEVRIRFQWFLALAGLCLRYLWPAMSISIYIESKLNSHCAEANHHATHGQHYCD